VLFTILNHIQPTNTMLKVEDMLKIMNEIVKHFNQKNRKEKTFKDYRTILVWIISTTKPFSC